MANAFITGKVSTDEGRAIYEQLYNHSYIEMAEHVIESAGKEVYDYDFNIIADLIIAKLDDDQLRYMRQVNDPKEVDPFWIKTLSTGEFSNMVRDAIGRFTGVGDDTYLWMVFDMVSRILKKGPIVRDISSEEFKDMMSVLSRKIENALSNIVVSYITPDVTQKFNVTKGLAKSKETKKLRARVNKMALAYADTCLAHYDAAVAVEEDKE
jgi:hypothetical protein